MRHSRRRACGSCQTCGRRERAHRSLQNRRRFCTAPTRLIVISAFRRPTKTRTPQNQWSPTHRFCGGGPFSCLLEATRGGKCAQSATRGESEKRSILIGEVVDPGTSRNEPQKAANGAFSGC